MLFKWYYILLVTIPNLRVISALPDYIRPCAANDPNLNECIIKQANLAMPYLLKYGNKHLNTPALSPYFLKKFAFKSKDNLFLEFTDVDVVFEDIKITHAKLDWDTSKFEIVVVMANACWLGDYRIEGTLFNKPIIGNGKANVSYVDGKYTFFADIRQVEINDNSYYDLYNEDSDFDNKIIFYQFQNMYGGDKTKSNEMQNLLINHWKAVRDKLELDTKRAISECFKATIDAVFKKAPASVIFLSNKEEEEENRKPAQL